MITAEGGTGAKTELIAGNYSSRTFLLSAKPGEATVVTVRAEGAIPAPVRGSKDSSTTTWSGVVSGAPKTGPASASILGDSAPYFGKVTLKDVNRNYSKRTSKVAYVFWSGVRSPACAFDEPTNSLTVEQLAGAVVKYAEDRAVNDQVSDLVSSDIPGIQQNVSYRAKVCYSNGFKMAETSAQSSVSTIADPADGAFEYTVELSSTQQSTGPYLFSWIVKEAENYTAPAGLKIQYSGDKTKPNEWKNEIYSTAWGEQPVIKVRYCNVSETICSAGQTLVKAKNVKKSWQMRISKAYLAEAIPDSKTPLTCVVGLRPQRVNFAIEGDGVGNWAGARPDTIASGEYLAQYQLIGSSTKINLDDSQSSFYRLARGIGPVNKLIFWFWSESTPTSDLEKVQVTIDVTC